MSKTISNPFKSLLTAPTMTALAANASMANAQKLVKMTLISDKSLTKLACKVVPLVTCLE